MTCSHLRMVFIGSMVCAASCAQLTGLDELKPSSLSDAPPPLQAPAGGTGDPAPVSPPETSSGTLSVPSGYLSVASGTLSAAEDLASGDELSSPSGYSRTWSATSDGSGQMTPSEQTVILPDSGNIAVSGSGYSSWGAGLELRFDGRTITDLGGFEAVEMLVRGTGVLTVELITIDTAGPEAGGICVSAECWGHYSTDIVLTDDARVHRLDFAAMAQPSWGDVVPLDPSVSLGFDFIAYVEDGQPRDFEFTVERVNLIPVAP